MQYVEIGRIMGAHGVRGDVKVKPYNPESPLFCKGNLLYLADGKGFKQYEITFVGSGPKGLRLHLGGVDSRDQAKALYDQEVYFPREEFPEPEAGEFYLVDMLNMDMLDDESGECYGKIVSIMETGVNDCLVVQNAQREMLVPVIDGVILDVDMANNHVTVCLPEGLLELYED